MIEKQELALNRIMLQRREARMFMVMLLVLFGIKTFVVIPYNIGGAEILSVVSFSSEVEGDEVRDSCGAGHLYRKSISSYRMDAFLLLAEILAVVLMIVVTVMLLQAWFPTREWKVAGRIIYYLAIDLLFLVITGKDAIQDGATMVAMINIVFYVLIWSFQFPLHIQARDLIKEIRSAGEGPFQGYRASPYGHSDIPGQPWFIIRLHNLLLNRLL